MQSEIILANIIVFIASCVQTVSGLGFALVAIPLLAVINIEFIPGPVLFISLFLYLYMFIKEREYIVGGEIRRLIPSLIIGVFCGAIILSYFPVERLNVLFASVIIIAVIITSISKPLELANKLLYMAGYGAGLMGSVSGIPGPPLAIAYQYENIKKMRATLSLMFVIVSITSLIALNCLGRFDMEDAFLASTLFPGLILGGLISQKYINLTSSETIRIVVLIIATFSAITLIIKTYFY